MKLLSLTETNSYGVLGLSTYIHYKTGICTIYTKKLVVLIKIKNKNKIRYR